MEKFRRFLHPVWTGFVLLIAAYVLRGVFLCARDTFLYNRLDLCDPADFKIYHRNTEPKRWRSQVHTYRLYGTLYPEIRNADMRVGYDAYSRYAIGDTIRVSLTEEPEAEIPVACELARICSEPEYLKGWTPLKGECSVSYTHLSCRRRG